MLIYSGLIELLFFSSGSDRRSDKILDVLQNREVQIPHDTAGMMG